LIPAAMININPVSLIACNHAIADISPATEVNIERLAIVLGFVLLTLTISVFLSCRFFISFLSRIGRQSIVQSKAYQFFYRYHSIYWWGFCLVLILHVMVAIGHSGLPQADDPDAPIHWYILGTGLIAATSVLIIFLSCRTLISLTGFFSKKNPLSLPGYKPFYLRHSFYWLIFAAAFLAHFLFGYSHAGVWPTLP
jgi:hypothetical protein